MLPDPLPLRLPVGVSNGEAGGDPPVGARTWKRESICRGGFKRWRKITLPRSGKGFSTLAGSLGADLSPLGGFFVPLKGERFKFPPVEDDVIYDDVPCETLEQDGRDGSSLSGFSMSSFSSWVN